MKKGLEAFTPLQVAAIRIVIAALSLMPFYLRHLTRLSRQQWIVIGLVGVIGNGIPAFLFPLAETHINSASAGVLNALSPLFALILGQLFFGFKFSSQQNVGVIIGFAGAVVLVMAGGQGVNLFEHITYSLLVVLATVGYGMSTLLIKKYLNETPPILSTGLSFTLIALPYGIYLFFSDLPTVMKTVPQAWESLFFVLILGAIGTALAVFLYYKLVQLTDPIVAASVTYVIPIVALGWGLLAGEQIAPGQYGGMAIILAGVFLANRKRKAIPKKPYLPQR